MHFESTEQFMLEADLKIEKSLYLSK